MNKYTVDIAKITGNQNMKLASKDEEIIKKYMIYLTTPDETLFSQYLTDSSYYSTEVPFLRSTILHKLDNGSDSLYLLDRAFNFIKFDVTHYASYQISK